MSIIAATYNKIINDPNLSLLLAADPLTEKAAVYEEWAHEQAAMPYIVQQHESNKGDHFAKKDALAIFDIFTNKGSINAENIAQNLIFIFDHKDIDLEAGNVARFYYNADQNVGDPEPNVMHWQVRFDVKLWRKEWIETL
jgi:hypothetical protein